MYSCDIILPVDKKRGENMPELRDLYDANSNKTDKTYYKGESIPDGYYPMVVMIVIRNSKGEFLMQKRVESKGGDWGVTGGHPKAGESPLEGIITEVKEELGLDFSNENIIEYDSGCDGKDCFKMYFVTKDIDLKEITIQEDELTEVRWFSMETLNHMVETKELNENQISCFIKVCEFLNKNKISEFFESEADKNIKYYRVIQAVKGYRDGRRFPLNEVVVSDKKVNIDAKAREDIGGFYISTLDYIFRWIIRGDTLCEVTIPEDTKIYKTTSENGIFVADKIILSNPIKLDEELVMKLYKSSSLPEISYFKAMTACAICGYTNVALKVCEEKVNERNVDIAIKELEDFCKRRNDEKYIDTDEAKISLQSLKDKLNKIKGKF